MPSRNDTNVTVVVNIISKWYEIIFLENKLSPNYIIEMIMIMTWTTLKTRTLTFERVDFAAVRLVSDDDIYTACRVLYSLFLRDVAPRTHQKCSQCSLKVVPTLLTMD